MRLKFCLKTTRRTTQKRVRVKPAQRAQQAEGLGEDLGEAGWPAS